jgi:hypothetical protein
MDFGIHGSPKPIPLEYQGTTVFNPYVHMDMLFNVYTYYLI